MPTLILVPAPSTVTGVLAAVEPTDTAYIVAFDIVGTLAAVEAPDHAAMVGTDISSGVLATTEVPDHAVFAGGVLVSGSLHATERTDGAAFTGTTYATGVPRPAVVKRPPQIPAVPSDATQLKSTVVRFAQSINDILRGGIGCTLSVTLAPSATASTVIDSRIGPFSHVILTPTTPSAQAAQLAGMYVVTGQGQATINHASNAATDQVFMISLLG